MTTYRRAVVVPPRATTVQNLYAAVRGPVSELIPSRPTEQQRLRLRILALSAKAATLAALMEGLNEVRDLETYKKDPAKHARFKDAGEQIEKILDEIEGMRDPLAFLDAPSYAAALAVAHNAAGRAAHLRCQYSEAIVHFQQASHRMPNMPDPYVNLAAALLQAQASASPDWQSRAEAALLRAIGLNGSVGKAHYYLGRLALIKPDPDKALEHFEKADDHPWMLYLYARLLVMHKKPPEPKRALEKLEQSIDMLPRPDKRYRLFVELVVERLKARLPPDEHLERRAAALAHELAESGITPELRAGGAYLLDVLKELGVAAPPPSASTQPDPAADPEQARRPPPDYDAAEWIVPARWGGGAGRPGPAGEVRGASGSSAAVPAAERTASIATAEGSLVEELFRAVDAGELHRLREVCHPGVVYERPGYETLSGIDSLVRFYRHETVIASGTHRLTAVVVNDAFGACWGHFVGRHRDGSDVDVEFADTYEIEEGKIRRWKSFFHCPVI